VLVPCWIEMDFIKKSGKPRHLVCNADESEPEDVQGSILDGIYSSFIDRRNDPSFALGANLSYIYIREYMWVYKILEKPC
jgi:NADH-quinone oxidoreductase subunit F